MLRYFFILLPLLIVTFVWGWTLLELSTDFILPTFLVFIATVGWFNFKSSSKLVRIIVIYISLAWVNEVVAYHLAKTYGMNAPVYHIYSWIQIILFGFIYSKTLRLGTHKNVFGIVICLLVLIYLSNAFYFGSIEDFPSLNLVLLSALILPLTLFQFRQMILFPIDQKLEEQSLFWFNFGTFIFFTFTFFMFGFLSTSQNLPNWMYKILEGANLFFYSTYFIAIILDSKPKTTKP